MAAELTASIVLGQKVVQERRRINDPLYLAGEKFQGPIVLSNEASRPGQQHFLSVTLRSSSGRTTSPQDAMYAMKLAEIQYRSGRDKGSHHGGSSRSNRQRADKEKKRD
jgi:hypothetical protein